MCERRAVVIKGSGGGGLGDRIRAVLVGFIYAELSDRAVFVDWSDGVYAQQGINAFEHLFEVRNLPMLTKLPTTLETNPRSWSGRLERSMDEVWNEDANTHWNRADAIARYSFDLGDLSHREPCLVMWDFDQLDALRPHLPANQASMDTESLLARAYTRYLSPSPELEAEVLRCTENVDGELLGMHVRATREANLQKGSISLKTYFRLVDELLARNDVGRIIVCTDNSNIEREILARYPNAWARQKWFAAPGDPLHLNEACPDRLRLAQDALVDMLLLARCDWLISVQNSSFSMLSRIMSTAPRSRRIQLSPAVPLLSRLRRRLSSAFGLLNGRRG